MKMKALLLQSSLCIRKSDARGTILFVALLLGVVLPLAAEQATVRASLQPPDARKAAPPFSLLGASGKTIRLSDYRGKVVLLNFWATECGGCRLKSPHSLK